MPDQDDDLDIDESFDDHRPEADFAVSRTIHTHAVNVGTLAQVLEQYPCDDSNIREMLTIIEIIRQAYGDKDELLNRHMNDLEQGLGLLVLESIRFPGRVAARMIRAIDDPAQRQAQIKELGTIYVALCEQIVTPTPDSTSGVNANI